VVVQKTGEHEYYLDGILKSNLDACKETIRKDWDYVFVIQGEVGAGKSVFAQQVAYYVSNGTFTMDQMCFTPGQFKDAILKAQKYDAIVWDECFRGLSVRSSLSQTNKTIIAMLQEIRQRNLFVFVVIPSLWDLDKYVALNRCKGVFDVYTDERKARGQFRFYKKDSITFIFRNTQKYRYRLPPNPQFKGRFTNYYTLDMEAYKAKKWAVLGDYGQDKKEENYTPHKIIMEEKWQERTIALIRLARRYTTLAEIGKAIGQSKAGVYLILRRHEEEEKQDEELLALQKGEPGTLNPEE